ncbi:pilin [Arenimonas metalli]|uniref:GYF domain-containing protein n=1 Tax=Arenimonas metalli CF5-1 TaxID=1384056 RepID=A0A091B241_9GAMM|nr:pilin [Arenimonas metalli]KFN46688.1 hypothetical protein N787_09815 [Arenimonas metalli CF5-1]
MDIWYYVDKARNRQGPVDAAAVAAAFQAGQLTDDSLVWRDGLAQWAPLRQFRDELGMGPPMAPAATAPTIAVAASPAAEDKKKNGCLIPALVIGGGGMVLVFILAILAAIALPAYQDYIIRAKLATALAEGRGLVVAVEEHFQTQGRCPTDFNDLGLSEPTLDGQLSVQLVSLGEGRCVIELALGGLHANGALAGRSLYLTRDENGRYACSSDLDQAKYLPSNCF